MKKNTIPPTQNVLLQFGAVGTPVLLTGGEGQSYKAGNVVLKPVRDVLETNWAADILSSLQENGFRVNRPIRSKSGDWVVDGWQSFGFLEGHEVKGRWREKIAVSRKFHQQLATASKPDFIGRRDIPWETADKVVWKELPGEYGQKVQSVSNRLAQVKKPLQLIEQLIHGDMTGNILFSDSVEPAIIDFSPYWRPADYATAIIIVDAIVWEGAPDEIFDELPNTFANNQLLVRAALWRIKTTDIFSQINSSNPEKEVQQYHHFIDLLLQRIANE